MLILVSKVYAIQYDVIIVRSDIPTDYVIASTYADSKKIPVILVEPDKIPIEIEKVLKGYVANDYNKLLIIGGKEAISTKVETDLSDMGFDVNRLWDWDRYGTAARVAIELWEKKDSAVIVGGENYQSLLIAHRYAIKMGLPVLFTRGSNIPEETKTAIQRLGISRLYCFDEHKPKDGIEGITIELMNVKNIEFDEEPKSTNMLWFFVSGLLIVILIITTLIIVLRRKRVPLRFLVEEEQVIVNIIKEKESVKQNELPKLTGFSKPKISRILQDLEKRNIITRKNIKKTYEVKLKSMIEDA